jgi:hypothetical protein
VNKALLDAVLRWIEAAVGGDLNESLGVGAAAGGGGGGGVGEDGVVVGGGDKASRASLAVSLLALLATWLHGCPLAVATLLQEPENLFLVEIAAKPPTRVGRSRKINSSSSSGSDECGCPSALASSVHGLATLVSQSIVLNHVVLAVRCAVCYCYLLSYYAVTIACVTG